MRSNQRRRTFTSTIERPDVRRQAMSCPRRDVDPKDPRFTPKEPAMNPLRIFREFAAKFSTTKGSTAPTRKQKSVRLQVEQLEGRVVPSVTVLDPLSLNDTSNGSTVAATVQSMIAAPQDLEGNTVSLQ